MNIKSIMRNIANENKTEFSAVTFNRQFKTEGDTKVAEEWLSFWNEEPRIRVSVHQDTFNKFKTNLEDASILVKPAEVVTPEGKEPYVRYVLYTSNATELAFSL